VLIPIEQLHNLGFMFQELRDLQLNELIAGRIDIGFFVFFPFSCIVVGFLIGFFMKALAKDFRRNVTNEMFMYNYSSIPGTYRAERSLSRNFASSPSS